MVDVPYEVVLKAAPSLRPDSLATLSGDDLRSEMIAQITPWLPDVLSTVHIDVVADVFVMFHLHGRRSGYDVRKQLGLLTLVRHAIVGSALAGRSVSGARAAFAHHLGEITTPRPPHFCRALEAVPDGAALTQFAESSFFPAYPLYVRCLYTPPSLTFIPATVAAPITSLSPPPLVLARTAAAVALDAAVSAEAARAAATAAPPPPPPAAVVERPAAPPAPVVAVDVTGLPSDVAAAVTAAATATTSALGTLAARVAAVEVAAADAAMARSSRSDEGGAAFSSPVGAGANAARARPRVVAPAAPQPRAVSP